MSFLGAETKYFYSLTPDIIDRSLEKVGFRPAGRTLALNSLENRVYTVEVRPTFEVQETWYKDQVVVKFYRPGRWSKEAILEEHQSILKLKEMEIDVIAPFEFEGETLFHEEESNLFYAVFPRIFGRLKDELNKVEVEQLGRLVGRMHGSFSMLKDYQHRGSFTTQIFIDDHLVFLQDFKQAPAHLLSSFIQLAKQLKPLVDQGLSGQTYQRIHGDLHRGNVLWTTKGPVLLDFDDSMQGPREQDLWLMLPGVDPEDDELRKIFFEGYEELCPFKANLSRYVLECLRTMRMIRFAGWIGKRYEDPFFQHMFPQYLTDGYWEQQVLSMKEQWALMQDAQWISN